jgi:acyl transferase domain-containing protein/NADPH:quinone reductase-like Zn-dependent oxidoreductase/acyl carrier protein/ubiquinone/menaquinone biosynthesis C-methylase UbiE
MGCRLPGKVNTPSDLWDLLCNGIDPITEIPRDRWDLRSFYDPDPAKPGKVTSRWGGFVDQIDQFDADFFGISPREAARVDPQHRMLLEVAYEAMENAGEPPERLAGSRTGVFVGISTCDYGGIQACPTERHTIDAYTNIGLGICIASNRISHQFDLHGPSVSVDTACSSSLVAVHMACQAIWHGECEMALAGGVNALLRPEGNIGFSKASMLAPDGHCKSFDARANGYVRSEGAGIILLKPLSKALEDDDPIQAVVRGTLLNQDGRTPGMALPSRAAQEMMLRDAYRRAGIQPREVHFVEAHGTGTPAGDPIELNAIGSVLGEGREAGAECVIGSIKSNIGHLEAASGIAGLIKAALCVQKGLIPANLHFETPNPNIPFESLGLRVARATEKWANGSTTRVAGVNSFGFGGTNAHVILEAPPQKQEHRPAPAAPGSMILPVAARSAEALQALARSYKEFLADENQTYLPLYDFCYSAALRREHGDHRLAVVGGTRKEMIDQLEAFAAGEARLAMSAGKRSASRSLKLAFVFSGMGPQWWGMGRQLLEEEPVFRNMVTRCSSLLQELTGWSLLDELLAAEAHSRIHETQIAQPSIFAIQAGLAALWRSWGIEPGAVVGHSVGEAAAAYTAGILTLEEAVRLVYHRSRLQKRTAGQGEMLAVGLAPEDAESLVASADGKISLAAVNSPTDITLSGDSAVLKQIAASLDEKQIFCRFLQVEVPYHSPAMDAIQEELMESLASLQPREAATPMYSTATETLIAGPELTADYWWRNVRNPVRFLDAIHQIAGQDFHFFVEVSAQPVLSGAIMKCLASAKREGTVVTSLRRTEPERTMMLASLGKLYALGYPIEWSRQFPGKGQFVRLPAYPWQRERHWHESEETMRERIGTNLHPLLGRSLKAAYPAWTVELDTYRLGYLKDHRVQDAVVYPAAAYVEMALAAGKEVFGAGPCVVEDLQLNRAIVLGDKESVTAQLVREPGQPAFDICSYVKGGDQPWVRHATGKLRKRQDGEVPRQVRIEDIEARCKLDVPKADFYRTFHKAGLQYGPLFQGVEKLLCGEREAIGEVQLHPDLEAEFPEYVLHPALLDSSFHVLLGAIALTAIREADSTEYTAGAYLPVRIGRVRFYGRSANRIRVHARLVDYGASHFTGDLLLLDAEGNTLAEVKAFHCRAIDRPSEKMDSYLYEYQWKLQARPGQVFECRSADYIPPPSSMAGQLQREGGRLRDDLGLSRYEGMEPHVVRLANAYLFTAFRRLGWTFELNQRISGDRLMRQLALAPQHGRLVERMLEILADDSVLASVDGEWEIRKIVEDNPDEIWRNLWHQFPGAQAELMLVRQCGEKLAEVLKGAIDPLEVIFPQGSLTTAEHLYQDAPSYWIYNVLAQKAVALALEKLPEDKTIRILEIGGGTGGMTTLILKKLRADRTEYVFSDVTQLLTSHAEQKFRDFPFVQYKQLDIETDPAAQGYEPHSFDIILASDVLHATKDLSETLAHVKQLLASKGLLVLLELTNTPRWVVLVFGLLKGWWRFTDTRLRPSDPWITQKKWKEVLEDCGFADVACVADTHIGEKALHSVVIAQGPVLQEEQTPAPVAAPPQENVGTWIIFADKNGIGANLAERFRARGDRPVIVSPGEMYLEKAGDQFEIDPASVEDVQRVADTVLGGKLECRGVVHLWNLDSPRVEETSLESIDETQERGCFSVLKTAQVISKINWTAAPRLWLVTSGTHSVGKVPEPVSVAQATTWGLNRTISNEHANLRSTSIDLSASPAPVEIRSLFDELVADDKEDEIVLRGESRYVHRLVRVSLAKIQEAANQVAPSEASQPFTLESPTPGILDNLCLRARDRRPPGPDQVEIQVCSASLNFKDVMLGLGLLPEEALEGGYTGRALGMECAGIISAVGKGVTAFKPGDEVVTSGPGALCSHMLIDAGTVGHKPPNISFDEATTLPIAFSTAYYALHHVARMAKGERVLIHAAAGGVGLAALQLAQRAGAEVFATAGSLAKRDLLRALGVRYVYDSRSLAFADEILEATGGEGVDIVLNSLAGDAIAKSFAVLRSYGRFVEIGKRDIYENNRIELRPFRNNLSYFAVDLDKLCAQRPDYVRALMRETMKDFTDGSLHPLAHRVFSIQDVVSAFRYIAQGKHIGKVVINLRNAEVVVTPPRKKKVTFRADATYLISGGLGGFGLAVAQWMVEHGARHVVLSGRSAPSPQAQEAIGAMQQAGAEIVAVQADVTRERDVAAVLARIADSMPELRGVIHAAMVLDDDLLHKLDDQRMRTAMAPKANGAWILHQRTLGLPLDLFVMFSSFSSIIGTTRQGNYVAGNAFVDALAHHRRAFGLPALTINWGVISGAGYVAQNADLGAKLEQFGFKSLPVQQMLNILGALLQEKAVQVGVGHLNWQQLAKMHMIGGAPRFAYLVKPVLGDDVSEAGAWLIDALMAVEPSERRKFLENHIREQLARVLGTSPSKVDVDKPLINLGLDSLMAVEIGNRMQSELGVSIPPVKFMEGLTTAGMAQYLVEQLTGDRSASGVQPGPSPLKPAALPAAAAAAATAAANGAGAESHGPVAPQVIELHRTADAVANGSAGSELETERVMAAVRTLSDREVDSLLKRMAEEHPVAVEEEEEGL